MTGPSWPGTRPRSAGGRHLILTLAAVLGASEGRAAGWELGLVAGRAWPSYQQDLAYRPPSASPLPGVRLELQGPFRLAAEPAASFGASLAWQATERLGLELRVDSWPLSVRQEGVRFVATVPGSSPPAQVDLSASGTVDGDRASPLSANLRWRSGGRLRVLVSAGVSYQPPLELNVSEELDVAVAGATSAGLAAGPPLAAKARRSFWGGNAGVGLHWPLSNSVSVVAEGRAFLFPERELEWRVGAFPISPELGELVRQGLGPIRFTPRSFQASAGLALAF